MRFIGQKVEVRYDPFDLRRIWLLDEKDQRHDLRPVDLYANRRAARIIQPDPKVPPAEIPPLRAMEANAEEHERANRPPETQDDKTQQNPQEENNYEC